MVKHQEAEKRIRDASEEAMRLTIKQTKENQDKMQVRLSQETEQKLKQEQLRIEKEKEVEALKKQ